ncbi:AAA-like domain-containing protein, partial [Acaryochloris marina NIES-2412]|uniref:AAA-like domain-containing protein n=1 Tax=Acaryochloris marina TaxID=155978 RepID=UPI0040582D04
MGTEIYTVGGTVQANEQGLYIPRKADQVLLKLCRESTFAYVLTPRQMGKSSLMMRTAETLYEEGINPVIIDLTQIGTQLTVDQWYLGLLTEISDQLMLSVNVYHWWQERQHLGGTQRLSQFFEQVVISEMTDPVVIFIDEIDTTLTLGFADDFYAAIRGLYVARAKQPELNRLSFVLIGVATPSDLIRDAKRTPFNVGERVELTDFTPSEALPMATGLGLADEQAKQLLGWVMRWTGGHPYLTQRLCKALVDEGKQDWRESDVDLMVRRTFLGEESEKDNNLQFVRDMLTKRAPEDVEVDVLKTYREVRRNKTNVKDEEQSLVKSHLKLAGVVKKEGEVLKNRNLIYQTVFDKQWIQKQLPESLWQRLKPAMPFIYLLSAISVGVSGLAVYAIDQSNKAYDAEQRAEVKARDEAEAKKETEIALEKSRKNETAAESAARESQRQKKLAQKSASLARRRLQQVSIARKAEVLERDKAQKALKLAERRQTEAEAQKNIAIRQRTIADKQRIAAEQATTREKVQTLKAQQATQHAQLATEKAEKEAKLATLREKASSALYWLSTSSPTFGVVLAIDTMDQSLSIHEVEDRLKIELVAQSILLKSIQRVQEVNLLQGHQSFVTS